jgi:hypothetical protein
MHILWNKKDDLPRSQEAANFHHPEPDDSSQRSQEAANFHHPEPDDSSQRPVSRPVRRTAKCDYYLRHVRLFVRLSAKKSAPTGRIVTKFDI